MLDLKKALQNKSQLQKNCHDRRVCVDLDRLEELVCNCGIFHQELQILREAQNKIAKTMKMSLSNDKRQELISEGRALKDKIATLSDREKLATRQMRDLALQLPNWTHPDVMRAVESAGKEIRRWGSTPNFTHSILSHQELAERHCLVDFTAATAVSGSKFVYLRDRAVLIEHALIQLVFNILMSEGFSLHTTPELARQEILEGLGFNPRGDENQIYTLSDSDLCLIGTSEITLGGMLRNRIFDESDLPLKLAGLSHCFRTEAGSHGKDSKGLYRLHQFTKVEMFAVTSAKHSENCLELLVEIQEKILQSLNLPYRIVDMPSGDLGGPAYRKYDIEVWMPTRGISGDYGEVTSASNCTDFQARRLNICVKKEGKRKFAHTLNATAIATSRILLALLENGQREDGSIVLPAKLAELCGFNLID